MKIKGVTILTVRGNEITDFAAARNMLLKDAPDGWVLFCDQDEHVTNALKSEIERAIVSPHCHAFYIKRTDRFLGKELLFGENGHFCQIRLAQKSFGKWDRPVHEVWKPYNAASQVGYLQNPLIHTPHTTVSSFIEKINRYSTIDAQYRYACGYTCSNFHVILYPPAKFIRNYIFLAGWRDGAPGFIMAAFMSYHSFLTWAKLYILCGKK